MKQYTNLADPALDAALEELYVPTDSNDLYNEERYQNRSNRVNNNTADPEMEKAFALFDPMETSE